MILTGVRAHPDTCDEDVSRKGESCPCDKVAVAVRVDPTEGTPYPVCGYHTRAPMVPLAELLHPTRNPDPVTVASAIADTG